MAFELIEASAGTGKTYSITSRYILLLIGHGLQVSQILVVTFTEAATAELRDRIRSRIRDTRDAVAARTLDTLEDKELLAQLQHLLKTEDDLKQAEKRLATALVAFDEAAVFTIHGFCRRVLREQAFASGMDFSSEVLTDDLPVLEGVVADFARTHVRDLSEEEFGWCAAYSPFFDGASDSDWRSAGRMMTPPQLRTLREIIGNPLIRLIPGTLTVADARKTRDPKTFSLAMTHALIAYGREAFARRKQELRVLSFGDMLLLVHDALAGAQGKRLAESLHDTFRAALIDEFQDTDPLQYDIIRRIYEGTECPVVFVGDPKQAIYSFRGGDVFAYFGATAAIPKTRRKTLTVNYRSARDLVAAITRIFTYGGHKYPFFDDNKTGFPEVTAKHEKGKDPLPLPVDPRRSAFHWFLLPDPPPPASKRASAYGWKKSQAESMAVTAVANEIARLVPSPEPRAGELSHGDIAVLVRSHDQASIVQDVLRAAGIPSIVKAMGNVFGSESASELLTLLRAIVSPGNESFLSAALLSPAVGYAASGLAAIKQNTTAYAEIADRFIRLRALWENTHNGFIRMAMELLYSSGIASDGKSVAEHLLLFEDAERRLTDMLHLTELLHQESILHPGHDHLLRWLEEEIANAAEDSEEKSIRLESDAKRVQIVTVHSSKGLEYRVVFCPFVWEGKEVKRDRKEKSVVFYHHEEEGGKKKAAGAMPMLTADLGSAERDEHFEKMKAEQQAEGIRLLYVALTRARQRCYAVWGQANKMEHAALTWLLFKDCGGKSARMKELSYQDVIRPVLEMTDSPEGAMSFSTLDAGAADAEQADSRRNAPASQALQPMAFGRGTVPPSWYFTSYSSLTSDWIKSGRDVDAGTEGSATPPAEEWSVFSFPAGARTGKMWHQLFERLDFQSTRAQIDDIVGITLRRSGYQPEFAPALSRMVAAALDTPLGPDQLKLRNLQKHSCVRELDFVYRIDRLSIDKIRRVLQDQRYGLPAAFHAAASRLRERDIRGFMIGTIDLLADFEGRYFLLDYKSNHLGNTVDRYAAPLLADAMADGHYYLQYLIYAVAVNRYLKARMPGYAYEQHFGGVLYLFLRGIREGDQQGAFFDRPSQELMLALESCLSDREGG
jgi:exodeoxyribonuclease V beta subunit